MTLNETSIIARLYRWFYDVRTLPNNLCAYFWRVVLMWVLLLLTGIFILPTLIFSRTRASCYGEELSFNIGIIIMLTIASFMIYSILALTPLINFDGEVHIRAVVVGVIAWVGFFTIMGAVLIEEYKSNTLGDNILVGYVKAKYNRYCPKIEWTSSNSKNMDNENK